MEFITECINQGITKTDCTTLWRTISENYVPRWLNMTGILFLIIIIIILLCAWGRADEKYEKLKQKTNQKTCKQCKNKLKEKEIE